MKATERSLFLLTIVASAVASSLNGKADGRPSICTPDFQVGTCKCRLNDGSGTMYDLTSLQGRPPLIGYLDAPPFLYEYYFTFCHPIIGMGDQLPDCNDVASVCRDLKGSSDPLGHPETTRFEMRSSALQPNPTPALVTETNSATLYRSVAFLYCNETLNDIVLTPHPYQSERDIDNYRLYFMDLSGSVFCPVADDSNSTSSTSSTSSTGSTTVSEITTPLNNGGHYGSMDMAVFVPLIMMTIFLFGILVLLCVWLYLRFCKHQNRSSPGLELNTHQRHQQLRNDDE